MKPFSLTILGLILSANMTFADRLDNLLILSTSADLITTEIAVRNPRLYESNPLMTNPYSRIGLKSLSTVVIITTRKELIKNNHKRLANILTGIGIGLFSAAAVNNYIQMRKYENH